ncbi:MAG: ATP-binding protein [Desulfovibrionaceae bacterium]
MNAPRPLVHRLHPMDRYLAPVLSVVLIGVLVSTLVVYWYTRGTMEKLALGQTEHYLGFLDRELSSRATDMLFHLGLWSQEEVFRLSLEDTYLGRSAREAADRRLAVRVGSELFDRVCLMNANGQVVAASDPAMVGAVHYEDRDYFQRGMRGESGRETFLKGRYSGLPVLMSSVPVRRADGTVGGVLAATTETQPFAQQIIDPVRIGQSGGAYILDARGEIIGTPSWVRPGQFAPEPHLTEIMRAAQTGDIVRYDSGGARRMCRVRRNAETGWYLVVEADEAEVLTPAARMTTFNALLSLGVLALVALALGALRRAVALSAAPFPGEGAVATLADITEQRLAEERLRQSEEKFSRLFRLSPDSIVLTELETGRLVDVNETYVKRTGYTREETLGQTTRELGVYADAAVRDEVYARLNRDGHVDNIFYDMRLKDGSLMSCSLSGQVLEIGDKRHLLAIIRDVTELKKMQEMMVQTEKMISVGGIAAGIAHEINNPLGIVLQAAQTLVQRTRPDFRKNIEVAAEIGLDMELLARYMQVRKLDVFIGDIQSAALRASSIIRHMLDFSRRSESKRTACDVLAIIDRALDLASSDYDLKKSYDFKLIRVVRDYDDDLPAINCTETEIEQVLLNLLRNAAQAMASADPPVLEPCITIRVKGESDRIRVEVEDNGPGMARELQRRIFEPFFTTKPPGVGTGLGLSVSYFIVTKGHGGRMHVVSEPGAGARFVLELPMDEARER